MPAKSYLQCKAMNISENKKQNSSRASQSTCTGSPADDISRRPVDTAKYILPNSSLSDIRTASHPNDVDVGLPIDLSLNQIPFACTANYYQSLRLQPVPRMQTLHLRYHAECPSGTRDVCVCKYPTLQRAAAIYHMLTYCTVLHYFALEWGTPSVKKRSRITPPNYSLYADSKYFHAPAHMYYDRVFILPSLHRSNFDNSQAHKMPAIIQFIQGTAPRVHCFDCDRTIEADFAAERLILTTLLTIHRVKNDKRNQRLWQEYMNNNVKHCYPTRNIPYPILCVDDINLYWTEQRATPTSLWETITNAITPRVWTQSTQVIERLDRGTAYIESTKDSIKALPSQLADSLNSVKSSVGFQAKMSFQSNDSSALAKIGDFVLWMKATYNTAYAASLIPNGVYNFLYFALAPLINPVNLSFVLTSKSLNLIQAMLSPKQRFNVRLHQPSQDPVAREGDALEEEIFTRSDEHMTPCTGEDESDNIYLDGDTIIDRVVCAVTRFPAIIATFLSALFVYLFFEKANDKDHKQRALTARISDSLRATNNIAQLGRNASGFQSLVQTFVDCIKEIISVADTWDNTRLDPKKLKKFIIDVRSLSAPELTNMISSDRETFHKVGHLITQEMEFMKFFVDNPDLCKNRLYSMFTDAQKQLRTLAQLRSLCHQSHKHPGAKLEPFVLCLYGKTNIGKSVLMKHLAYEAGKLMNWSPTNLIYSRNPADKFWSRYDGNPVVLQDDWAQSINTEQAELEMAEMFAIKTAAPYQLQMADISEKGKCFSSELLIQSTNSPWPPVTTVRDLDALYRRREIVVEVVLHDEKIMAQNRALMTSTNEVSFSHLHFNLHDPVKKSLINPEPLSYAQFVELYRRRLVEYYVSANTILYSNVSTYEPISFMHDLSTPKGRKSFLERFNIDSTPASTSSAEPIVIPKPASVGFDEVDLTTKLTPTCGTEHPLYVVLSCCVMLIDDDGSDYRVLAPEELGDAFRNYDDDYLMDIYRETIPYPEQRRIHYRVVNDLVQAATDFDVAFDVAIKRPHSNYQTFRNYFTWLAPYLVSAFVMKMLWDSLSLNKLKHITVTCFEESIKFMNVNERLQEKVKHKQTCPEENCPVCTYLTTFDGFLADHDPGYNAYYEFKSQYGHQSVANQLSACSEIIAACKCQPICPRCDILYAYKETYLTPTSQYHAGATKNVRPVRNVRASLRATASSEEHRMQIIKSCEQNFGVMYYATDRLTMKKNVIVGLKDRYVLINKHFFNDLPIGRNVNLKFNDNAAAIVQEIRQDNVYPFDDQDVVLLKLDAKHHQFKDITKHFISDLHLSFDYSRSLFVGACMDGEQIKTTSAEKELIKVCRKEGLLDLPNNPFSNVDEIALVTGYRYLHPMAVGTSGSLAYSFEKQKFFAYQSGSFFKRGFGFAGLITKEMIESAIKSLEETALLPSLQIEILEPKISTTSGTFECDLAEGLDLVGVIEPRERRRMPDKTQIIRSCIQHHFTPTTAPAILSQAEFNKVCPDAPASFAATGVDKYSYTTAPMFPLKETIRALDIIFERMGKPRADIPCRLFTWHEVLNGLQDSDAFGPMNFDSSGGHPYIYTKPGNAKGKAYLFEWYFANDGRKLARLQPGELLDNIQQYESSARQLRLHSSVYIDCPKDERRSMKKVLSGNTRMFTIAPVHHLMLHRKYFGAIRAHIITDRHRLTPKVGVNPMSPEWTLMYHELVKNGMENKNFLDRDVSAFDGWRHPAYTQYYTQKINEWYRQHDPNWCVEDDNVRTVLAYDAQYRYVMNRQFLYRASRGLISGKDMTDIDNSIQSEFYSLVFWICNKPKGFLDTDFYKYVSIGTYGDDVVEGVNAAVLPWFNLVTIQKWFAKFGIKITDAQKKTDIDASKDLREIQFLKRKFDADQRGQFRVLAPLAKETIEEMPLWIHKNKNISEEDLTRQNVDSALREAVYHGKTYFNEMKQKWNTALLEEGIEPVVLTYDGLMEIWLDQFEG
jgi:hypothetical protein